MNRIDTEELVIQLYEVGIDVSIGLKQNEYTVELTNLKDNVVLGVAKNHFLEGALATVIRRLADDSKMLKYRMSNPKPDKLSEL